MSIKDAYYFPHDSNAKDDPKIVLLIDQLGLEAYGFYWVLIETLRDQPDYCYPVKLLPALAKRYGYTEAKARTVVYDYMLFEILNDSFFLSQSLVKRMAAIDTRRKELSEWGKEGNRKRWGNRELSAGDRQAITERSGADSEAITTQSLVKESKVKESKVKESKEESKTLSRFQKPSLEQIKEEFKTKLPSDTQSLEAVRFFNYYEMNGWRVGKNPMKNWQAAVSQWISRANSWTAAPSVHSSPVSVADDPLYFLNQRKAQHS